jgi:hypothetical protein
MHIEADVVISFHNMGTHEVMIVQDPKGELIRIEIEYYEEWEEPFI